MSDVGPIKAKTDRIWYRVSGSGPELARNSDPTAHFAFVMKISLTKLSREISLFAKGDAEMKDQGEPD
jgi:hypothetical protein